MGVYLGLSALDFPFCFAAVQWLGVERIGHAEKVIVGGIREFIPEPVKDAYVKMKARKNSLMNQSGQAAQKTEDLTEGAVAQVVDDYDHGVTLAEKENKSDNASKQISIVQPCYLTNLLAPVLSLTYTLLGIWTQLALAYAIHKSFIFIRVPITVAVTPKVVKTLRGWGWDIGKRRPKAS